MYRHVALNWFTKIVGALLWYAFTRSGHALWFVNNHFAKTLPKLPRKVPYKILHECSFFKTKCLSFKNEILRTVSSLLNFYGRGLSLFHNVHVSTSDVLSGAYQRLRCEIYTLAKPEPLVPLRVGVVRRCPRSEFSRVGVGRSRLSRSESKSFEVSDSCGIDRSSRRSHPGPTSKLESFGVDQSWSRPESKSFEVGALRSCLEFKSESSGFGVEVGVFCSRPGSSAVEVGVIRRWSRSHPES